jgi:hypothetical protein
MGDGDELDFASTRPAEGYAVCAECFDDCEIQGFINSRADAQKCDFCGRRSRKSVIATPLDEVVEFMLYAINREYERAVEALGWESAEGGYLGTHWDSEELLNDVIGLSLPNDDDGRLLEVLVECLGDEPWCERDPYGMREDERLLYSWERFSEFVKYQRRYFFLQSGGAVAGPHSDLLDPSELLRFLEETVREHRLVRTIRPGSLIYRVRQQKTGESLSKPFDFAPPPVEKAVKSNRMSPAGVVMFYGSDDPQTAVAEVDDDPKLGISVGTFKTTREVTVLDLTRLPRRIPFFRQEPETQERPFDRSGIAFLHDFVASLAAKVEKGDREHIDYVPPQVVTEWFRTIFHIDGSKLDGIYYPSAQQQGGTSIVLFATQRDVVLTLSQIKALAGNGPLDHWWLRSSHENAWLRLVRKRMIRPPRP